VFSAALTQGLEDLAGPEIGRGQRLKQLSVVGAATGTCRMVSVRAITTFCLLAASSPALVALVTQARSDPLRQSGYGE
jgi:TRAP-type C4-dicarboxylate transport system permease large subunit